MADCTETLRDLQTYLDGELPDRAREHVEHHLDGCLDCLQAFDFHAELREVIRTRCTADEMPPTLLERLRSCLGDDFLGAGDPDDAMPG